MKADQNGFSAMDGLLVLIVTGLIGGIGWYVWQSTKQDNTTNTVFSQTGESEKNKEQSLNEQDGKVYCFDGLCLTTSDVFDKYGELVTPPTNYKSGFWIHHNLSRSDRIELSWDENLSGCGEDGCNIQIISVETLPNYPEASLVKYSGVEKQSEAWYYGQSILSTKCVLENGMTALAEINVVIENCHLKKGTKAFSISFNSAPVIFDTLEEVNEYAKSTLALEAAKVQLSLKAE